MATYKVQVPDGSVMEIEGPDGATDDQLIAVAHDELQRRQPNNSYPMPIVQHDQTPSPAAPAPDPTSRTIATTTGIGQGLAAGMLDPIAAGMGAIVPNGAETSIWQGPHGMRSLSDAYDLSKQQIEGYHSSLNADHPLLSTAGEIAGSFASPLAKIVPGGGAASSIANSAVYGGIYGAATDKDSSLNGAVAGALSGAAGDALLRGAGRVVSPKLGAAVTNLKNAGISLTPGQAIGGVAKHIEDLATHIPVVGDAITSARNAGLDSYNRAEVQRVLTPIGETLPSKISAGHEAIAHAQSALSDAYDSVIPHLSLTADPQLGQDISAIRQRVTNSGLAGPQLDQFNNIYQGTVLRRFDPNTMSMKGADLQSAQSDLKRLTGNFSNSTDGNQRELGQALGDLNSALDDGAARWSHPDLIARRDAINAGYARLTRLETAGAKSPRDGVFSPTQMLQAARQGDQTVRNRATASGKALGQDLAKDAATILPSKVGDSGTTGRAIVSAAMGGAGSVGALLGHPIPALVGTAATLPYLPLLRKGADWALTGRQGVLPKKARGMFGALAPAAGTSLPLLLQPSQ